MTDNELGELATKKFLQSVTTEIIWLIAGITSIQAAVVIAVVLWALHNQ